MNHFSPLQILAASLAGGVLSVLVFLNRGRAHSQLGTPRGVLVLSIGSAAFAIAHWLFQSQFGSRSPAFAAMVAMLAAAWISVLHTVLPLKVPRPLRRVSKAEMAILRRGWTGVRAFGWVLCRTPLRHLGGGVYLRGASALTVRQTILEDEAIHLWAVLFMAPWFIYWGVHRAWSALAAAFAVNLLLNLYPILHLRLALGRLDSHLDRKLSPSAIRRGA